MIDEKICIGCQACVDICPARAIRFTYNTWGEGKAYSDGALCVNCGLCDKICPGKNVDTFRPAQTVYAAISREHRQTGSSGGIFYEIASGFISDGGVVFGAAFDSNLKLVHQRAESSEEILALCKSKYLHSDMTGIYRDIQNELKKGRKVMFVGTPCQASAVKNLFGEKYADLLTVVDFLCHGTGTQKVFDCCIREEEKKRGGKITEFRFRAKSRKAEHSFSYRITKNGKDTRISGYAFEFSYYNAFLKYTVFNDACYNCQYAQNARVGDITLGDFWKIQKYNKKLSDQKGVSMLSVNSERGRALLDSVKDTSVLWEYPLSHASSNNQSFNGPVPFPKRKRELENILEKDGETALVNALACTNVKKNLIYAKTPESVKKIYQKLRGRT